MLSVERRCAGKRATCSPASAPPAVGRHGRMAHARCRRFRALSARGATSLIRRGRRTPTVRGIPGAREAPNKCVLCRTHTTSVATKSYSYTVRVCDARDSRRHDSGDVSRGRAGSHGTQTASPFVPGSPRGPRDLLFRILQRYVSSVPARSRCASDASRETGSEPGRPYGASSSTDPRAGPLRPVSK